MNYNFHKQKSKRKQKRNKKKVKFQTGKNSVGNADMEINHLFVFLAQILMNIYFF